VLGLPRQGPGGCSVIVEHPCAAAGATSRVPLRCSPYLVGSVLCVCHATRPWPVPLRSRVTSLIPERLRQRRHPTGTRSTTDRRDIKPLERFQRPCAADCPPFEARPPAPGVSGPPVIAGCSAPLWGVMLTTRAACQAPGRGQPCSPGLPLRGAFGVMRGRGSTPCGRRTHAAVTVAAMRRGSGDSHRGVGCYGFCWVIQ
jgi:hypothetical protein